MWLFTSSIHINTPSPVYSGAIAAKTSREETSGTEPSELQVSLIFSETENDGFCSYTKDILK